MERIASGKRTRDVDLLGIVLCAVGGIGFFLSLREAFAYRVLLGMGKESPLPFLYFVYNQLFLPLLTVLLLISGGGILQRKGWARPLVFILSVAGFCFFVLLNIDALIRVTVSRPSPPIAVPIQLYLFIYLIWGFLIWFFLKEPVRLQFEMLEVKAEEEKKDPDISYHPFPKEYKD